ncbi:hypothetical protein [Lysinibacillus sp. fls2-241-R2A-57]|uniref:hypothetical protein n=1 Tax=Lysinibacillus sp. fls2-241-R2A-57 TaxID=3040292 RepID=UPI0025569D94|nr:hypothetical protein [Lysinibacillus sp. fls2-241-R2A-57]
MGITDETLEQATRVKRFIGHPQKALLCAKAKRQRQMFYLRESEAAATKAPSLERKSTTRYGDESFFFKSYKYFHFIIMIIEVVDSIIKKSNKQKSTPLYK